MIISLMHSQSQESPGCLSALRRCSAGKIPAQSIGTCKSMMLVIKVCVFIIEGLKST